MGRKLNQTLLATLAVAIGSMGYERLPESRFKSNIDYLAGMAQNGIVRVAEGVQDGIERLVMGDEIAHEPVLCAPEEKERESHFDTLANQYPSFVRLEAERRAEIYQGYATFQDFLEQIDDVEPLYDQVLREVTVEDRNTHRKRHLTNKEKEITKLRLYATSYVESEGDSTLVGPSGELTEFQLMDYHLIDAGIDPNLPIARIDAIRVAANLQLKNLYNNEGNHFLADIAYNGGGRRAREMREAFVNGEPSDELVKAVQQNKDFPSHTIKYPGKKLGAAKAFDEVLYQSN